MAKKVVFELDENQIKLVLGEYRKHNFLIDECIITPSNPDFFQSSYPAVINEELTKINNLLKKANLKTNKVNIIIPDSITYNTFLELPKLSEKELYAAVKFQADQFIPTDLKETNIDIDILDIDKTKNKVLVLVVAVEKKIIEKIVKLFENFALIPEKIENQLSSLGKVFYYASDKENVIEDSLFINFGFSTSTIYFYRKDKRLIFLSHTFKNGYDFLLKELVINTNLNFQEASKLLKTVGIYGEKTKVINQHLKVVLNDFLKEINQSFHIAKNKYSLQIKSIYLFNLSEEIKGFSLWLNSKLTIPVKSLNINNFIINKQRNLNLDIYKKIITTIGGLI